MIDCMWMWMLYQIFDNWLRKRLHIGTHVSWRIRYYPHWMASIAIHFSWVIDQIFYTTCVTIHLASVKLNLIKALRNWFFFLVFVLFNVHSVYSTCFLHVALNEKTNGGDDKSVRGEYCEVFFISIKIDFRTNKVNKCDTEWKQPEEKKQTNKQKQILWND